LKKLRISREIEFMDSEIDRKLDEFFEKSSPQYMDMSIFEKILIRINELENTDTSLYFYEMKRIRDLKNCIDTAREEGFRQGLASRRKIESKIEVARGLLRKGLGNQFISETTGLSLEEIEELRNE
jgi:predicted transposase/invertase (TIGR01784 family)